MTPTLATSAASTNYPLIAATTGLTLASGNVFYIELLNAFFALRWAVLFIIVLIITDFWSGLAASVKVKKEAFRWSRAIRRTMGKFMEYICYIVLALLLAKGILIPLGYCNEEQGAAIGAAIALFVEINSIYGHVCALHGITQPLSLKRIFVEWLKRKNNDLGEAIDEAVKENEKK